MKRKLMTALALVLAAALALSCALADQIGTVKGGWLRLRAEPSFSSATLASYQNGATVTVLGQTGSWYQVRTPDGLYGYMYSSYLTVGPGGSTSSGDTGRITSPNGRGVRLRATPAVSPDNVIGLYNVGTSVKILSRGSTWHYVRVGTQDGYMMAQYITESAAPATPQPSTGYTAWITSANGKPVRLRAGAGTNFAILGSYSVGREVTVLQHGTTWDYIRINGQYGYMMNQYLTTSYQPVSTTITSVSVSSANPTVGQTLTAVVTPGGASYSCQWFNDQGSLLSTGTSYQVKASDTGRRLLVIVTGTGTTTGTAYSAYTNAVTAAAPYQYLSGVQLSTSSPTIGSTVYAIVSPSGATAEVRWYRSNGQQVGTGSYYTVQNADAGYQLYCVAMGTGAFSGTVLSPSTSQIASNPGQNALSGTVVLPATVAAGTQLYPNLYLNTLQVDYAWYCSGGLVSTNSSLYVTSDMLGQSIRLTVSAQAGSGYTGSVSSESCFVAGIGF